MNRKIENSKVLVTGGAGFIGSNLVDALLQQNNQVVVLDNFCSGKRENLAPYADNPNFTLIEGDIRNFEDCVKSVDGVDYVLHHAALGSVPGSIVDPMSSSEVNITGFVNMLFAAQQAKVKRFVYAASSSTYGDDPKLPKVEDEIGKPLSPYAITKYVNEMYADIFNRIYGIDTVGLRDFNVFGRRQDPCGAYAAVIPKFVMNLMAHESPIINGDGSFSRDFTYIDNVVQVNQLAALAPVEAANTIYNVAHGERTSLNELLEYLKEELSKLDPKISEVVATYGDGRVGDIPHSVADISKAKNMLGYDPQFNVREGIIAATQWYFDNL